MVEMQSESTRFKMQLLTSKQWDVDYKGQGIRDKCMLLFKHWQTWSCGSGMFEKEFVNGRRFHVFWGQKSVNKNV